MDDIMLRMPDITQAWSILAGKSLWSRGLRARLADAIMQAVRQAFGIAIGGNLPEKLGIDTGTWRLSGN